MKKMKENNEGGRERGGRTNNGRIWEKQRRMTGCIKIGGHGQEKCVRKELEEWKRKWGRRKQEGT